MVNCECADYKLWRIFFLFCILFLCLFFFYFFSSDFLLELGVLGMVVCMVYVLVARKGFQPSDIQ